jgi:hypothetical protein
MFDKGCYSRFLISSFRMADFRVAASESFAYLREQQVDLPPLWVTLIAFNTSSIQAPRPT